MKINLTLLTAQTLTFSLIIALAVFLPAGNFTWPVGWLYWVMLSAGLTYINIWLLKNNPELLQERMSLARSDQKGWDKLLFPILLALPILLLVFVSLDAGHFHWSLVPFWGQAIGLVLLVCSFVLFMLTYRENTFLSTVVRIQKERGHKVVSTGPYHYVRHPMYTAFVLVGIGSALLLGSWYGVLAASAFALMIARRAVLEEQTLETELEGYAAYMKQVKYRFFPYIW